jgi:predicted nucleic acid-binding protein
VIVVDSNVLLYAVGTDHPHREASKRLFDAVAAGTVAATTTPDVIQEFTHVYGRRRTRRDASRHARRFAILLGPLVATTNDVVVPALDLYERYEGLDAFDALLAAAARHEGASALVSADRAFAEVKRLPFVELGSPKFDELLA